MVLLGGLELVAAGYLVHRHQKNKKERERLEAEAMQIEEHEHRHRERRRSHSKHSHSHSHPHSHRSSRRPSYPCDPNQKPGYYAANPTQSCQHQRPSAAVPQASGTNGRVSEGRYPPTGWPKEWENIPREQSHDQPPTYHPYGEGHNSSSRLYSMSTPNLVPGYQSNTGLSDDFDQLSMDGIEVYDPDLPPSPHVHFALPDGPQPGERHAPPPPYRP